jgi:hypothetical protein
MTLTRPAGTNRVWANSFLLIKPSSYRCMSAVSIRTAGPSFRQFHETRTLQERQNVRKSLRNNGFDQYAERR